MKKVFNISIWVLFILGVFALMSFSLRKRGKIVCHKVVVNIDAYSGDHFVTPGRVKTILKNIGFTEGKDTYSKLDIKKIERKLLGLSSVEFVEVVKNIDGTLEIEIKQRKPIARVFNRNGNTLYLDDKGKTMQTSSYYTARVLVINGFVNLKAGANLAKIKKSDSLLNTTMLDELMEVASYIEGNEFLKAQIEQVYVKKNKEIVLIPKVGSQEIIFGKIENVNKKFEKLLLFYKNGINPENLNIYKTINLKFDNQIVCKKNK